MKLYSGNFMIIIAFVFVLSSCAVPPTIQPTTIAPTATIKPTPTQLKYQVSLSVLDDANTPIPAAKIFWGEQIYNSDNNGNWKTSTLNPEFKIKIWAQGYSLQEYTTTLQPGNNSLQIIMTQDTNGLQLKDLNHDGYKLVFVEDFQDNFLDCAKTGNGDIVADETTPGNMLLLVDLSSLDTIFSCAFGPVNIQDAIIEVDFRYPEIRYDDFDASKQIYNWQGFSISFRDYFTVEGYPIHVPWGSQIQVRDFSTDDWKYPIVVNRNFDENRWYTFTTKYNANKVDVSLDQKLLFTYLDPPSIMNSSPANIGAFGKAIIQFDNIKMWVPTE